jgi:hypothetical protein
MTTINIGNTRYTIDWSMGLEDLCEDCYEWDRKDFIGQVNNMRVYELYAHGGECWLIESYDDSGSYVEGIAGTPTTCDYDGVDE